MTRPSEMLRLEIRRWLTEKLPTDWRGLGALAPDEREQFVANWRKELLEAGYLAPTWPVEHGGGGHTQLEAVLVAQELARVGAPNGGPNDGFSIRLLGNTLLAWGNPEQKRRFLPRLLSGEHVWCQGYSEPDAGSDLANVHCAASLRDGAWILRGQKTWTTGAHLANWIFLLARTSTDEPKHRGLSFMLCPLDQPGIEVRRIGMMSGPSEFNEVFFDGATVNPADVVGPVGGGWRVAMALVGYERGAAAATKPFAYMVELDRLISLAREKGRLSDPSVRQRIAGCYTKAHIMRFLGERAAQAMEAESQPGADASINKLFWSEYHQEVTELAVDILGPEGMIVDGPAPAVALGPDELGSPNSSASWLTTFLSARADTIYQGTSEIQRNTIAERVLGLPKGQT